MKRASIILVIIQLVVAAESRGQMQDIKRDFITLDLRKNYTSKKELILQDFMDVEYIALETNNDFVNQGVVVDVGKEIIIVRNGINDGDIFIYNRLGKSLRKINRRGQSGEEYINFSKIALDEEKGEIFVNDISLRKIFVYDLFGKFKRSFNHKEGTVSKQLGNLPIKEYTFYTEIFNYDKENLICYDRYNEDIVCFLISKQDGHITKEIKIPFKKKKSLIQEHLFEESGKHYITTRNPGYYSPIIPYKDKWILLEMSSDTVYTLLPDHSLCPFLTRIPSVQSMNPEVMLALRFVSDSYYFMETIRNEYNFNTGTGFPKKYLMYDVKQKTFGGYKVFNSDYLIPKEVFMVGFTPANHEIAASYLIQAYQLVESYKKGELKEGKLKEIASKLDEEDNPVIMLVKHKK